MLFFQHEMCTLISQHSSLYFHRQIKIGTLIYRGLVNLLCWQNWVFSPSRIKLLCPLSLPTSAKTSCLFNTWTPSPDLCLLINLSYHCVAIIVKSSLTNCKSVVTSLSCYQLFWGLWICWLDFHTPLCWEERKCSGQQLLKTEKSVQKLPHLLLAATLILQHFSSPFLPLLHLFLLLLYFYSRNSTNPSLLGGNIQRPLPSRGSTHLPCQCLWLQCDETVIMFHFVKDTLGHSTQMFLAPLDSSPASEGRYQEFLWWWEYMERSMLEK